MKKIVKPHKARKSSASTDVPSFARGKDQILKNPARLQRRKKNELGEFDDGKEDIVFKETPNWQYVDDGSGNLGIVDTNTGQTGTFALPELTVSTPRPIYAPKPWQYSSTFDGSLDNTLNTLDAMTGGTIGMAPVLGDALDGLNVVNDVNKGDYTNAGIGLGLLALPNFIEKPITKGKKLFNLSRNFIKNKAKAVKDFTGNVAAFLAHEHPNIFTGKYKGNKYLDNTIDKFYKEDIYGRYKKAFHNPEFNRRLPEELRDEYEKIIGKNGNPSEIRTYLGSGNMLAFVSPEKPNYIFARKSQLKNPDNAGQVIVHEGNHSQTDLLRKFIKRYENDLHYDLGTTEFGGYPKRDLLDKAYNFSDEAYKKVNSPIDEKAATNREIRFDLFKRTGKTGDELNEVIDNLSDSDLKNLLSNYSNYYRRQFRRNFKSDTADYMRKALKIVPATLPIAIGASLYNDQDGDPNYNYNKGKDSGIHIKKKNRGKFTALKKRTGKSASWFKEHGTPAQKKMAIFALNARKWKH